MNIQLFVPFLVFLCTVDCRRNRNRQTARDRNVREDSQQEGSCELELSCKGDINVPLKMPIRGPRGPAGTQGNKGERGETGMPGLIGPPGKSVTSMGRIAFFVGLDENIGPIKENIDIVFDKVITNVGGAYDETTGRFSAPYNGTYHFTAVVAAQGRQKAAVMLMKEGTMIATVWAESFPSWAAASNTAILNLQQGEQVWLVLLSRAPYLHGYMYSTFSGHLLFRNDDPEEYE